MGGWGEEMNTGEGSGLWSLPCEEGLGEDSTENKVIKKGRKECGGSELTGAAQEKRKLL